MFDIISYSSIYLMLLLFPAMWTTFENVLWCISKECIFFFEVKGSFLYKLSPFGLECHSVTQYPCQFFGSSIHCWQWGVKILYYKCVAVYIFCEVPFDFLMYLCVSTLDAYMFTMVISPNGCFLWILWSVLLCLLQWPLVWSLFSLISIATLALLSCPIAWNICF